MTTQPAKKNHVLPTPTPADIEAVLASIQDRTNILSRWYEFQRIDSEEAFKEEVRLGRTMFWADIIDPSNTLDDFHMGGGRTPAEAAAAAWVHRCIRIWPNADEVLTDEVYRTVPRTPYRCS